MSKVWKLIGGILGGLTGASVAGVLAVIGVDLPTQIDTSIALILAWIGTFLAPPNEVPS